MNTLTYEDGKILHEYGFLKNEDKVRICDIPNLSLNTERRLKRVIWEYRGRHGIKHNIVAVPAALIKIFYTSHLMAPRYLS